MTKTFDRDGAFSMNVGEDRDDKVEEMLVLGDQLYAFSTKTISRVLTADNIDPQRIHLGTRHSHQKLYDVGCGNPFVARSIIQAKRILDGVVLRNELEKKLVLDAVWEACQLLLQCERSHFRIYGGVMALLPEVDQVIEKSKSTHAISSLPQVADLEEQVAAFLGSAKRFLEKAHSLLCLFYGCPNKESNFRAYREWMKANRNDKQKVTDLLNGDQEWTRFIAEARNALPVNHSRENYVLEIRNFALEPGNRFSAPAWKYDLSDRNGPTQVQWSDIVTDMQTHLENLLTFYEELLILCILDNVAASLPFEFQIFRLANDEIKSECPVLYVARATVGRDEAGQLSPPNKAIQPTGEDASG